MSACASCRDAGAPTLQPGFAKTAKLLSCRGWRRTCGGFSVASVGRESTLAVLCRYLLQSAD